MKKSRTSSLMLLELIITILLFSICAAVCVSLLAGAHRLNRAAEERSGAVNCVSNLCEAISSARSVEEAEALLAELFPALEGNEKMTISLDRDFKPADAKSSEYQLHICTEEKDHMLRAMVELKKQGAEESIYERSITVRIPRRR